METKCANGFTGLLPQDRKSRFYYVCKSNAVLTCACKPDELFNGTRLRCEGKNQKSIIESGSLEEYTDTIVGNIMEKYRCTQSNEHYENDENWMPTTEQYVTSIPSLQTRDSNASVKIEFNIFNI